MFGSLFRVGGSNGAISGKTNSKMVGHEIGARLNSEGRVAYLQYEETGNKTATLKLCRRI